MRSYCFDQNGGIVKRNEHGYISDQSMAHQIDDPNLPGDARGDFGFSSTLMSGGVVVAPRAAPASRTTASFASSVITVTLLPSLMNASAIAMAPRGPSVSVGGSKSKRHGKPNQQNVQYITNMVNNLQGQLIIEREYSL